MSEAKFTKGPWDILHEAGPMMMGFCVLGEQIWVADYMTRVCFTEQQNVGWQEERANAHLIASAPEMYEVLLIAEGYALANKNNGALAEAIAEVLAKARGES